MSPGCGTCGFAGLPGRRGCVPYQCVSPAWQTPARTDRELVPSSVGAQGHARRRAWAPAAPRDAHARPRETCPCMASLCAINPRALGFAHAHVGTGGGAGGMAQAPGCVPECHAATCVRGAVPCWYHSERACMCARGGQLRACVCMSYLCPAPCCSMPCRVGCHPTQAVLSMVPRGYTPAMPPLLSLLTLSPFSSCRLQALVPHQVPSQGKAGALVVPIPAQWAPGTQRGDATVRTNCPRWAVAWLW